MKKLLILLLVLACLISSAGCGNESKKPSNDKGSTSQASSAAGGALTTDVAANAEYIPTEEGTPYKPGSLAGTQSTTYGNVGTETPEEIIPTWEDSFKLHPMSGESDKAASSMREKILNSKDSVSVKGKKYYVSSLRGDDKNDGLSPERPFKTLTKADGQSLNAGDAILLERGSVFRLSGTLTLKSGITYAAYGEGNKPAVYGSPKNFADKSLWEPWKTKKNIWAMNFPFQGDVGNVVFDHGAAGIGCSAKDYVLSLEQNGDFYFDSTNSTLYIYCDKGNPGRIFKDIEVGARFILFNIPTGGHDIHIDNLALKYSGFFAVRGLELDNIDITNCEIAWIGGAWQTNGQARCGNGIEVGGVQNSTWKNNWFYQIFDSAITFQLNTNTVKNNYFTNNLFEYCGMSALEWWQSTKDGVIDGIIEDVYFTGNISRFHGYGWMYGLSRGARHLQGPFQRQDYPNMKNFVIKDNIFDKAMGAFYLWGTYSADGNKGHIITQNTYYKAKTDADVAVMYGLGADREAISHYANDQKSLEKAIAVMDTNPKSVKWVD